jgi:hypothetical protein
MRLTPDSRAPAKADPSARAGVVVVVVVGVVVVVVVALIIFHGMHILVPSMDREKKKHSHGGLLQSCRLFRGQV